MDAGVWIATLLGLGVALSIVEFVLRLRARVSQNPWQQIAAVLLAEKQELLDRLIGLELLNSKESAAGLRYLNATLAKRNGTPVEPELTPPKWPDAVPLSVSGGLE